MTITMSQVFTKLRISRFNRSPPPMFYTQEFPSSVIEKIGYYVYFLKDPVTGEVFYIGKGTGNRIFAHLNAALALPDASDKLERIRNILSQGNEVSHWIVRHGLTEKEAFEVESALIDFVGLGGLTNLVQGHGSDDRGQMSVVEVIAKYDAPDVEILEPVILITVNRLFRRGIEAAELYEATRGNWVVGTRRERARYAFSVYNGIIREVYRIDRWFQASARKETQKTQRRWRFEGEIAYNLQRYVGRNVGKYLTVGSRNPIRYVNC